MNLTTIFKPTAAAAAVFCFASCGEKNAYVAPPPPPVDAQPPLVQDLTVYREFQGRTEAFARFEVRARVTGFLESVEFKDGQYVKQGDPLFTIDPIQFQAAVESAEGSLRMWHFIRPVLLSRALLPLQLFQATMQMW